MKKREKEKTETKSSIKRKRTEKGKRRKHLKSNESYDTADILSPTLSPGNPATLDSISLVHQRRIFGAWTRTSIGGQ